MKKSNLLTAAAILALCQASPLAAQTNGTAGGMNPQGNSTFGGGGASSLPFNDYATARRLLRNKDYANAIPYLDNALTGRPHSAEILTDLGLTHRMIGELPAALAYDQKALSIDADYKAAHEDLGEVYLALHDAASANAQLADLTRLCPDGCDEKDALTKAIGGNAQAATTPAATTPNP